MGDQNLFTMNPSKRPEHTSDHGFSTRPDVSPQASDEPQLEPLFQGLHSYTKMQDEVSDLIVQYQQSTTATKRARKEAAEKDAKLMNAMRARRRQKELFNFDELEDFFDALEQARGVLAPLEQRTDTLEFRLLPLLSRLLDKGKELEKLCSDVQGIQIANTPMYDPSPPASRKGSAKPPTEFSYETESVASRKFPDSPTGNPLQSQPFSIGQLPNLELDDEAGIQEPKDEERPSRTTHTFRTSLGSFWDGLRPSKYLKKLTEQTRRKSSVPTDSGQQEKPRGVDLDHPNEYVKVDLVPPQPLPQQSRNCSKPESSKHT